MFDQVDSRVIQLDSLPIRQSPVDWSEIDTIYSFWKGLISEHVEPIRYLQVEAIGTFLT